jgi:tetratricopeptide (TPR) repeat protein
MDNIFLQMMKLWSFLTFLLLSSTTVLLSQNSDGYYLNAVNLVNAGELDQAFGEVNKALKMNPEHPQSLILRAYLLLSAGDKDAAIADYSAALKVAPSDLGALTNRAMLYMEKEDYESALRDLKQRYKYDPYNWMVHYDLAYCYGLMAKYDLAITGFTEAIKRNPDYADAYLNRGYALYNKHSNDGLHTPASELLLELCEDFYKADSLGLAEAKKAIAKFCSDD